MSVAYSTFHATRWGFYLVRLVLSWCYGLLQFIGKPGSRYIVPLVIALALYLQRPALHPYLDGFIVGMKSAFNDEPEPVAWARRTASQAYYGYAVEPWVLDCVLVMLFLIASGAYVLLSRTTMLLLGAFPQVKRPLRPLRRLEATKQDISSAVVKIVVPKLPR